jgi:integrase
MSKRPNESNERIKRQFLEYRKYARQLSEKSLDREIAALERFDVWNGRKDFSRFHIEQAMGFRKHLEQVKSASGKPLGKSTLRAILATMREFILWLSQQDGFRSRIKPADADYFSLSRRDEAEARAAPPRPAPSVTQARRALAMMPAETPRDLRDKAIFAFLCLTGIRVAALVSLRIKHVNLAEQSVTQNPREVATKFGEVELYSPDDPLFPATGLVATARSGFTATGFERRHWRSTEPVRKIVRAAFERSGLPNYGPHAFRHMLARHAVNTSTSVAEIVANSQNLGHTDVLTTLRSYGQISRERQRALVTGKSSDE